MTAVNRWLFELSDLNGVPLSALGGVTGRTFTAPIRSIATAAFTINTRREEADALLNCATLLRVYEDRGAAGKYLHGHLEQVGATESNDANGGTVTPTFADPGWELGGRLIGKTPTGFAMGTAVAPVDRGAIVSAMVAQVQGESPLRIRMGNVAASSLTFVKDWYYRPVLDCLAELAGTLDGPDWRVRPIEYDSGVIGELDIGPALGQFAPEAVLEFGGGRRNVASYSRTVDRNTQANAVYHLPSGFPGSAVGAVLGQSNAAAQGRWGLREAVVSADLTVDDLRLKLLNRHLAARSDPRQTMTVELATALQRTPPFRDTDGFGTGDVIPFRAWVYRGGVAVPRVNANLRVYQTTVAISDLGVPTITPTIAPSDGAVAA